MVDKIQQRFDELQSLALEVSSSEYVSYSEFSGNNSYVNSEKLGGWIVKAENLISNVCGINSNYYSTFVEGKKPSLYATNLSMFKDLRTVFNAAKDDYEKGYLTSYKSLIQAEVFGNELEQARELLSSGYVLAAAVITGTVLETSIRELCDRASIPHGKLDKMNADLAKHGTYNSIQQKSITAMAGIRNSAAHGKPEDFNDADVTGMIASTENFLIKYLD